MSLVAHGGSESQHRPAPPVPNNGFWPDIEPGDFRDRHRIETTITEGRVVQALGVAMRDINRQLAAFQARQRDAGVHEADAVPSEPWQMPGDTTALYRQAVYASAHASLLEAYRDYSATRSGEETGEVKDEAADDYRRNSRWAVAEILGDTHTTVELI
ncbi:head completion/stabilization protein [Salinicola corii]|uniref:Head completion/stabilization protein n=1 Tax=Salinicola corii TaxID=2606937 RepID=A0A640W9R9_9GAMM|nr:head completion/stabilization protein [Salinicola corii]KAA0016685.1 head completion/stabilization protein [Salinicola corii]